MPTYMWGCLTQNVTNGTGMFTFQGENQEWQCKEGHSFSVYSGNGKMEIHISQTFKKESSPIYFFLENAMEKGF